MSNLTGETCHATLGKLKRENTIKEFHKGKYIEDFDLPHSKSII